MEQTPETIACPYCGNINPFMQENCMKCKRPLGPIRAAMQTEIGAQQTEHAQTPPKPIEPAPPMPDLPKGKVDKIKYLGRKSFLIRGMGEKNIEIAARFFKRLNEKDLKNVALSVGVLNVDVGSNQQESREYYFVRKDLELSANEEKNEKSQKVVTDQAQKINLEAENNSDPRYVNISELKERYTYLLMAIRIAPVGPDLYVEWRNYYCCKLPYQLWWWWGLLGWFIALLFSGVDGAGSLIGLLVLVGFVGLFGGLISLGMRNQNEILKGFQLQENEMFQLSVRATLEEAIDLAGIPKSLIQNNSMAENNERII